MTSKDSYNVKVINDIIYNEVTHIVSVFKDFLIYDDVSEFLRRVYKSSEAKQRLPKVFDFYDKYSKVFPNYVVLPESKNMFKNIEKKQKLIDEQQRVAAENKTKQANLDDSEDDNQIFNTLFLNELNKPGSTYDMNSSQQTESQLFSYIKNSRIKNSDVVVEKSFQNLLEKVLLKESMSFADPSYAKGEVAKKNVKQEIKQLTQPNPAFCKIQIDDKKRSSCLIPSKVLSENTNYISHLHPRNKEVDGIEIISTNALLKSKTKPLSTKAPPQKTGNNEGVHFKLTTNHDVAKPVSRASKAFSPSSKLSEQQPHTVKTNRDPHIIQSPKINEVKKKEEIKIDVSSKDSRQEQSRNVKWQPKENDHYLTNNIFSDPSTRTHSSLKTPKPSHKFTDIDIQKLISNINTKNDRQKYAPVAIQPKRNNTPSNSKPKMVYQEPMEKLNTERVSLQSRNSSTHTQLSIHNKPVATVNVNEKKECMGLILDIESINKHAKQIINDVGTHKGKKLSPKHSSSSKTPDPMSKGKNECVKAKPVKQSAYQLPQTVKSINNSNRLLFSKSVSNCDKLKYRLEQKTDSAMQMQRKDGHSVMKSSNASNNAQTPGSIHTQTLFKYNK